MRAELEYKSKTYGECPSDYDFSKIVNPIEFDFLKWTDIIQSVITRLKYNIEMFDYFFRLYLLNDVIKKFDGFYTILLTDLSAIIAIDFSNLFTKGNGINIFKFYNKFCNSIVLKMSVDLKKQIEEEIERAVEIYEVNYKTPRDKIYAHTDNILLNNEKAEKEMKTGTKTMKKLLNLIIKIVRQIWKSYNGQNLCFSLKKGNDYKKITKTLCVTYGDTRFI